MLWCIFLKHTTIPERISENPVSIRIRKMLEFIERHYAEEISPDALAKSAGISCSETIRFCSFYFAAALAQNALFLPATHLFSFTQ